MSEGVSSLGSSSLVPFLPTPWQSLWGPDPSEGGGLAKILAKGTVQDLSRSIGQWFWLLGAWGGGGGGGGRQSCPSFDMTPFCPGGHIPNGP